MAEILLKDIKKIFIDKVILQKANLTVESGDKIGLIGANGAGKTTLFKIILGEISYDDGDIFAKKALKIGYLEQHLNLLYSGKVYDTLLEIFSDLIAMEDRLKHLTEQISKDPHSKELLETYSKLLEDFNNKGGYSYPSMIRGTLIGLG
ncbi:MAG: ATP-binding cassette domain-containing protein, partial [Anaerococcus sp.]